MGRRILRNRAVAPVPGISYGSAGAAATGTTETSLPFTTPAAATAGQLLIAAVSYQTPTTSDIANTAPAGWTKIGAEAFDVATTTGTHLCVIVKAAVGGLENHTWTLASAPTTWTVRCHAYDAADTTAPFDQQGYGVEPGGSTTTSHTAPTFTPTVARSWGVAIWSSRANEVWTPGAGLKERSEDHAGTGAVLEFCDSGDDLALTAITYGATETLGTSVCAMFAGNIKLAGAAPAPDALAPQTFISTAALVRAATW